MSGLALNAITKQFGPFTAVDNVELSVPHGTFVCLLGPSGCGKTTLLRLVAGLDLPSAGRIRLDGADITDLPAHRRDFGMLPPGDFRNCLAALSDAEGLVSQLMQYRFGADSDLEGHSFGNLYLTAMTAITGSFEAALAESSRVLAVRGQVIPSTLSQVTLCAEVLTPEPDGDGNKPHLRLVRGESKIGRLGDRVQRVYLEPEDVPAYPGAIRAILEADLIVIGPGSLYTSVLPNLLVPDLARALAVATAPKVYVCNVATQAGETEGYDVDAHVDALQSHIGRGVISLVLANNNLQGNPPPGPGVNWVQLPEKAPGRYRLVTADLVDMQYPWRHDSQKLAHALMALLED